MRNAQKTIYFDFHATTPTDPRVVDAMLPYFSQQFGNASSTETRNGVAAREAVEAARSLVAQSIGAQTKELVFTSGATEANNMAILGGMRHLAQRGKRHLIVAETEHKCVLEAANQLTREGFTLDVLPVDASGNISLSQLKNTLCDDTGLVSLMLANNETGLIHPLKEISELVHSAGALLHTDAAQGLGKIPIDVTDLGVDMMSISAHKAYGPMGVGALYLRHRPRARIEPLVQGGGQERGLRSGTLPTPLIVGFGKACDIISNELAQEAKRIETLRNSILTQVPNLQVNGSLERRLPGNLNLSFPNLGREAMLTALQDFSLSSGSACSDTSVSASYVLKAMGLDEATAQASIRVCIGRTTEQGEVARLIETLKQMVAA